MSKTNWQNKIPDIVNTYMCINITEKIRKLKITKLKLTVIFRSHFLLDLKVRKCLENTILRQELPKDKLFTRWMPQNVCHFTWIDWMGRTAPNKAKSGQQFILSIIILKNLIRMSFPTYHNGKTWMNSNTNCLNNRFGCKGSVTKWRNDYSLPELFFNKEIMKEHLNKKNKVLKDYLEKPISRKNISFTTTLLKRQLIITMWRRNNIFLNKFEKNMDEIVHYWFRKYVVTARLPQLC